MTAIRGVGKALEFGGDGISTYMNGVYSEVVHRPIGSFWDTSRIEILRDPKAYTVVTRSAAL